MTLGQLRQQVTELCDLAGLLGEDPHDCVIKSFGEHGRIDKLVLEMPEQTITREWKNWDRK